MRYMGANEIRRKFLEFFESKDHYVKNSYSLVPHNDKSLLLINAGMAPIKNYFLGVETPPKKRMATCQKCVRTGDIDNVGQTARHATFFEMLGNFSFGDYFKKDAINFAWEFITKVLEIEEDKLWVTVYEDDDEAFEIWEKDIKIPKERIVRLGKEDNFWEIGSGQGPCGPCSEIYLDRGEEYGSENEKKPGDEGDRFLEFWNLVFTQFDQQEDGSYKPLAHPNIDTGMGLERIACIMQGVDSIFDIDTMKQIRDMIADMSSKEYGNNQKDDISIRIITDHIRAITFMVSDGIVPSNEGRGYVLRRLARRAIRHTKLLGIKGLIFEKLSDKVIQVYADGYPELLEHKDYIHKILNVEEEKFTQTLDNGMILLDEYIDKLKSENKKIVDGQSAFKLYDTYGFPVELTVEIAKEKGFDVDMAEFESEMENQKNMARSARAKGTDEGWKEEFADVEFAISKTQFLGYDTLISTQEIKNILVDNKLVDEANQGDDVVLIFEKTPFYATSGGQTADKGVIVNGDVRIDIEDVSKTAGGLFIHKGKVKIGKVKVGEALELIVDKNRRYSTARNHTATHLLHKALKVVLGDHVNQSGSEVSAERLRFDFSHFEGMSKEQIRQVERIVNENIFKAMEVTTKIQNIEDAKKEGAMALFDEKYDDEVRVLSVGDFSMELCGGTHVKNSNDIGMFKIISEGGVASGIRRIEAITGQKVYQYLTKQENLIENITSILKTQRDNIQGRISEIIEENKNYQKEIKKITSQSVREGLDKILENKETIKGVNVIISKFEDVDMDTIRDLAQSVIDKETNSIVLFTVKDSKTLKVSYICMIGKDALDKGYKAGDIIREVTKVAGGKGGGRPNMAQGAAPDSDKLDKSLEKIKELI